METERTLMGWMIVGLCLLGLWHSAWFLRETRKGERIADWFGPRRGLIVLRVLFCVGAVLGVLIALGVLRGMAW